MKFSVLASVYIKEIPANLALALESVFNQTVLPNEVILVKDGLLTEDLENIIIKFKSQYPDLLKIISLEKNVGLGNALNTGLKQVSNEIVARMDTDDICYPDRFEKQINFLKENPEISIVGGVVQEFDETPGDLQQFRKLPLTHNELYSFSKYRNPLSHPSVMFRKAVVLKAGSYKDMPLFEDYYLWIRIIMNGFKIANISEPILHFRVGNDMIGRRSGMSYIKKEIHFLKTINNMGFISNIDFLKSVLMKLPLRVLPKRFLAFIYKRVLR